MDRNYTDLMFQADMSTTAPPETHPQHDYSALTFGSSNSTDHVGGDYFSNDDYADYDSTRIDGDPYLLLSTLVVCIAMNILMCCLVSFTRRRRKQHEQQKLVEEATAAYVSEDIMESLGDTHQDDLSWEEGSMPSQTSSFVAAHLRVSPTEVSSASAASPLSSGTTEDGFEAVLMHFPDLITAHRGFRRLGKYSMGVRRRRQALEQLEIVYRTTEQQEAADICHTPPALPIHSGNEGTEERDVDHGEHKDVDVTTLATNVDNTSDSGYSSNHSSSGVGRSDNHCNNQSCMDVLSAVARWDIDMKRLFKLAFPFVLQVIIEGGFETLTVAVIGKLLGTQQQSAYVIVKLFLDMTEQVVGGLHESLATLCSHALESNKKLVGEYVQLSVIFSIIFTLPISLTWFFCMEPVLGWIGFDETTVRIGKDYAMVLIADHLFVGINESIHALLDTIGLQGYSTVLTAIEELVSFLLILILALFGSPSLQTVGMVHFLVAVAFLLINIGIIVYKGWFEPYMEGMTNSFALKNVPAVKHLLKTGLTLSLGYILTEGEWEILTIFASYLGPSAVVAWGILGTLWDVFEQITEALGDAAEVRCAYLLGAGFPERAQMTAYKTIFVGSLLSGLISSFIFTAGDYIPLWLTNDEILQVAIESMMPFFALGIMALTLGNLCWTILGSQGRYRLATAAAFCGTCFVCIPLAAVFSIALDFDLSGQTAALVVGYMVSGSINAYFVFTSDWLSLSEKLMSKNSA